MPKGNHFQILLFSFALFVLVTSPKVSHSQERTVPPVADPDTYVVPFSHLDLFWAGTREECLARGNRIFAKAISIARQHPEFRFLLESDNFIANYVDSHAGSSEVGELKSLVKQGKFAIAPNWADIFLNLPDGEVQARNFLYGRRFAQAVFGVVPRVYQPTDIPGFPPQLPQMIQKADIPFMVMTRMGPLDKPLFNWQSPDGSKALVWNSPRGYGWGAHLNLHGDMTEENISNARQELKQVKATTPGPTYMLWGVDLWAPNEKLVSNVERLNREVPTSHFALGTPQEFFAEAARVPNPPTISGDIPMAWPHVVDGILHLWQLAYPATNTLESAEKFATINYTLGYADYPQQEFETLWKALIESMDHNHDGQGGEIGDTRKMEDSQLVIIQGGEILRHALRNIAERVQLPVKNSAPIVVFNAQGWKRSDFVRAHITLYGDVSPAAINDYKKAMRLVDETGSSVPFYIEQSSDNISRALDIIFVAEEVPSLGYKTYFLVPAEQPEARPVASKVTLDRENDVKDPRRPLGKDTIENQFYRVTVDRATGGVSVFDKQLNHDVSSDLAIVGVEERGTNNVQREILTGRTVPFSVDTTGLEENNSVRTVFRISGRIADIPIVQRLILYQSLKRLDLENSLDWNEPRFLQIQQLVPVPQGAAVYYGSPFAATAVKDIFPGAGPRANDEIQQEAWQQYRTIQSWVAGSTPEWSSTLAADHQLVKVEDGLIRAAMIRGQRYTSVKIVRGDEVDSVHFPAKGHYVFRYSFSSGSGDWKAMRSYQAGMSFTSPLIPVSVVDNISAKSLPPTYSFLSVRGDNAVVSALKKSEADASIILRVYEIQGAASETPVTFLGRIRELREINLIEENMGTSDQQVLPLKPFEIKTVRMRSGSFTAPDRLTAEVSR